MFHETERLTQQLDAALWAAGLQVAGGGFVARRYQGVLGGRVLHAELSVMTPSQLVTSGYVLTFEIDLGVPARLIVGGEVPLLLGRGLPVVGEVLGHPLRCHDGVWGRRLLASPALGALGVLLAEVSWLELVPSGRMRVQLQRTSRPVVPDFRPLVHALGVVMGVVSAPPGPSRAPSRSSDQRGLMLGLIAVVVLGLFGAAIGLGVLLGG